MDGLAMCVKDLYPILFNSHYPYKVDNTNIITKILKTAFKGSRNDQGRGAADVGDTDRCLNSPRRQNQCYKTNRY